MQPAPRLHAAPSPPARDAPGDSGSARPLRSPRLHPRPLPVSVVREGDGNGDGRAVLGNVNSVQSVTHGKQLTVICSI